MSREGGPGETDTLLGAGRSIDVEEYHDAEDEFESEDASRGQEDIRDQQGVNSVLGGVKHKIKKSGENKKKRRILQKAQSTLQLPLPTDGKSGKPVFRRLSVDACNAKSPSPPVSLTPVQRKIQQQILEKVEDERPTEEKQFPDVPSSAAPRRACPEFFGVKSYLHTFYESVSIGSPSAYEMDSADGEYRYLIAPGGKRRTACLWKVAFYLGINLLAFGLVMILVGYLVPKRPMVVGHEEDMEIIDKSALNFNKNLDLCKLVGLIVFCLGGTILVAVLLFPSIVSGYCDEEHVWSAEAFRVRVDGYPEVPDSPTEKKVPATEELSSIQPKREPDEGKMIMTNSGLCEVP